MNTHLANRIRRLSKQRGVTLVEVLIVLAIMALIAGILILIMPRLLNFIVAFDLILVGLIGLNGIYHIIRL